MLVGMRVHLGSDHAGFEFKQAVVRHLTALGHEPVDHGPERYDAVDDYPPFVLRAAEATAAEPGSLGIVLGGSGNGEQIAANKVAGVWAALAWSVETAMLAWQHNDATVIGLGARMHTLEQALEIVDAFVATPYVAEARHARRIAMLTDYEKGGGLPPLPA